MSHQLSIPHSFLAFIILSYVANPKEGKQTCKTYLQTVFDPGPVCELKEFTHNCFSVFRQHLFIGNKQQLGAKQGLETQYSNCLT